MESEEQLTVVSTTKLPETTYRPPRDARQKRTTASGTAQNRAEMKERRDGAGMGKKGEKLWEEAAMPTRSTKVD